MFSSSNGLGQHIKTFHEKTYPCSQCRNKYFRTQHNLDIHIQGFHSQNYLQKSYYITPQKITFFLMNNQGIIPYTTQQINFPLMYAQNLIPPLQPSNLIPNLPSSSNNSLDSLDSLFNVQ